MEQLRHKLTQVSPKGQRRSVDQNTLKRSDLDDFVGCCFGRSQGVVESGVSPENISPEKGSSGASPEKISGGDTRLYNTSRHDRKETERFNPDKSGANRFERVESARFRSFTYEELIKRDP